MAEESGISWTDSTYNPWIGCTRVSPACDFCYAARDNERYKFVPGWGVGVPRKKTKTAKDVRKWEREWEAFYAAKGRYRRVFCASMADVFDNEVAPEWRDELWALVRQTLHLRWLILTKRIGNARKMLPADWGAGYPHVGLMATLANQEEWDRDFHKLMATPAAWHGVSAEPLLGHINIGGARPDWIISGGESGPRHRALDMDAVRSLRDQCARNGVTFHHKQNGGTRGKDAGCLVDGREHKFFPPALEAA